jgi:hypothetical protein
MTTRVHRSTLRLSGSVLLLALAVGCGSDDDGGEATGGASGGGQAGTTPAGGSGGTGGSAGKAGTAGTSGAAGVGGSSGAAGVGGCGWFAVNGTYGPNETAIPPLPLVYLAP